MGLWLMVWHWALYPQTPGQGSTHFVWMHALSLGQSDEIVHSGLQPLPIGEP